jgi:hypothetical protein
MTSKWLMTLAATMFLSSLSSNAAFADSTPSDVQEIMQSMNRAYAGLKTYQDDGIVLRKESPSIDFSYQFVRPNLLRFTWRQKSLFGLIDGLPS